LFVKNFLNKMKLHFIHEEEFMQSINYTYINYHKEVHETILYKLADLMKDKNLLNNLRQDYFINSIRQYLLKHIDEEDRQIGIFLKTIT